MRRIFKLVSIVLAFALVSAGFPAYALADSAPKKSEILLSALGITDEDFAGKAADGELLTRAAAVYYALKVTGYTDIPKATDYVFSDVGADTDYADAIMYAVSTGVAAQGESFFPEREVTAAEFMKMVDTALGYTDMADAMGGWPSGYMAVSKRLGMFGGAALGANDKISYAQLEKILSGILMSGYVTWTGADNIKISSDENVLYKVFDVYKASGRMTANAVTSLNTPEGAGENTVKIEGDSFAVDAALYPELARRIGQELNLWVRENDVGDDEVICYEEMSSNRVTEIYSEDFKKLLAGKLEYESSGSRKTIKIPASANVIYNGKAYTESIPEDIFNGRWGKISVIYDGSTPHTVVATAYDNYFAGKIDKDDFAVYDNTANNRGISFKDESDDEISEYAYFETNAGRKISFSDITENSVLSVAQNGDYYEVIVTTESVSGTVKSRSTDGNGKPELVVDSNRYRMSPELSASRIAEITVGNTYTFYLDAGGRIAAGVLTSSLGREMNWVYLIDIKKADDEEGEKLYFKILTPSGEVTRVKNAERLKIDGVLYKDADDKLDYIKSMFDTADASAVKSQVMRLAVNDDGEVSSIDTAAQNPEENKSDSVNKICDDTKNRIYKSGAKTFGTDFAMSAGTVIFNVPLGTEQSADKGQNSQYGAVSTAIWTNDEEYNVSAYNTDRYSRVADVVVTAGESVVPVTDQEYVTVITKLTKTLDEDDEMTIRLEGLQNNSEINLLLTGAEIAKIDENTFVTAAETIGTQPKTIDLARGDVIRYALDKDNKISQIQLLYDCSAKKLALPDGASGIDTYARQQFSLARAYRLADGYLTSAVNMSLDVDNERNTQVVNSLRYARVYEVDADDENAEVTKSGTSAIRDWYNYGRGAASYMFIQNRYNECRTVVIYNYSE